MLQSLNGGSFYVVDFLTLEFSDTRNSGLQLLQSIVHRLQNWGIVTTSINTGPTDLGFSWPPTLFVNDNQLTVVFVVPLFFLGHLRKGLFPFLVRFHPTSALGRANQVFA